MKRLVLVAMSILLFFSLTVLAAPVAAENWYKTPKASLAWEAVTTLKNGNPIPQDDVIKYNVFVKDRQTGVVTKVASEILATELTISLVDIEGFWYLGVQAVRYVAVDGVIPPGDTPYTSDISWSSDPVVCASGEAFGVRNHIPPGQAKKLGVPQ